MSLFKREKRPERATLTCQGCGACGTFDLPAIWPDVWTVRVETVQTGPDELYPVRLRVTCNRCGWHTTRPSFRALRTYTKTAAG